MPAPDDFPVQYCDCPHGNIVVQDGKSGLFQRQAHPVGVAAGSIHHAGKYNIQRPEWE